jgi:hypothetical protein
METSSSLPKHVLILRWVARISGTIIVIFFSSIFIGSLIRKGFINVADTCFPFYILLVEDQKEILERLQFE